MSATDQPGSTDGSPDSSPDSEPSTTSLVEAILDSLPTWTVIAAAITFLYLVWATLDVIKGYAGGLPGVGP